MKAMQILTGKIFYVSRTPADLSGTIIFDKIDYGNYGSSRLP